MAKPVNTEVKDTNAAATPEIVETAGVPAVQEPAPLVQAPEFDMWADAAANAGAGTEKIGAKDVAIPTLRVLQSNSHEVEDGDPKKVEGAKAGDFFAMGPDGPIIFPGGPGGPGVKRFYVAQFEKAYIEWVPFDAGGGFVARHPTKELAVTQRRDSKNEIVETNEYYGIVEMDDGTFFPVLFGCSGSKLTPSRNLNTILLNAKCIHPVNGRRFVGTTWMHVFELTTQREVSKKNGKAYFNFKATKLQQQISSNEIYLAAQSLHKAVLAGTIETFKDVVLEADETLKDSDIPDDY